MFKKVLVITAGLHIGGAERVAANISKYAPEDQFEFHYLVFDGYENVYGPEIEEKGGNVITFAPPHNNYAAYLRNLIRLMREQNYAAVHSHTMFNSGLNMLAARLSGIPVRITHSHTTRTEVQTSAAQKTYEFFMQKLINSLSTDYYACGIDAGNWLFGKRKFEKYGHVIKNGIETSRFAWSPETRCRLRREYHLEDAFVIGHTGSLVKVKNQAYLIELMPEILKRRPNAVLMLVGGGNDALRAQLEQLAQRLRVRDHVIFTGAVHNVNEYLNAFDVFAFPSTREGTPLSLLEAQANGIPCVVSQNVPTDVFLTDLITVLSLDNQDAWVDKICAASRLQPERYGEKIAQRGYDAHGAYQPVYHAYMKKENHSTATVSLSFDDGREDNTWVIEEILLPRKLPVTLNITTGYIDGSCPEEDLPASIPPMKLDDVIRLGKNPLVEIALHGDRHKNTVEDILACRRKLIEWLELEDTHVFGMASPGSCMDQAAFLSQEYDDVRDFLLYLRISLRNFSYRRLRVLARKVGRVIHLPILYRIAYQDTLMRFRDGKFVYSVPIMGDIRFEQVRGILDSAINQNANITLMFHSIGKDAEISDPWAWSLDKFQQLCAYLQEKQHSGQLIVRTTKDMYQNMD